MLTHARVVRPRGLRVLLKRNSYSTLTLTLTRGPSLKRNSFVRRLESDDVAPQLGKQLGSHQPTLL